MDPTANCQDCDMLLKTHRTKEIYMYQEGKEWKLDQSSTKDVFREEFTTRIETETGRGGSVQENWEVLRKELL